MNDSYITLKKKGSDEIVIQKSRFIGYAAPCSSEEEALSFLRALKDQYRDATHHCYAYIIGKNSGIMRYSDDGEPGGTAGLPMISVLRAQHIVNCVVVVVRYFGGTLLGTGGLVKAYTKGTQIALTAAEVVQMEKTIVSSCEIPYSAWDTLQHAASRLPVRIDSISYGSSITFSLFSREAEAEKNLDQLQNAVGRKIILHSSKDEFFPWNV